MNISELHEFIKSHTLAVVPTVDSDGRPESAVVEFGELMDLTIIIDTLTSSRKYKNIQDNKNVAIVIGWDDDITLQINAVAHELSSEALVEAKKAYFAKNERARKWESKPDIAYFAFKPTWVRYSDVSSTPWLIEESTFGES